MSAYRSQSAIRATFELGAADLEHTRAQHPPYPRFMHPVLVTLAGFGAFALFGWLTVGGRAALYGAVAHLLLGGCLARLLHRSMKTASAPANERLARHGQYTFVADDDGVLVESDIVRWSLSWRQVTHWDESEQAFRVFLDASRYQLVPKRGLDGGGITSLRQMLTDRAPQRPEGALRAHFGVWVPWLLFVAWLATLVGSVAELLGN